MAKVLSISSQVVYGHVGNSVASFALQSLGHEVLSLPTILLSNRPGYIATSAMRLSPNILHEMLEAGLANGWLNEIDAIVTGYLPTEEHATLCAEWVNRLKTKQENLTYLCDPILGDEPAGLYIDKAAAYTIRDSLLPIADIATPNNFELGWLTGRVVSSSSEAIAAARLLTPNTIVVTSVPSENPEMLQNLLVGENALSRTEVRRRQVKAHGTGDFFASVFLAGKLGGIPDDRALEAATMAMEIVLDATAGASELALVESRAAWAAGIAA